MIFIFIFFGGWGGWRGVCYYDGTCMSLRF